MLVLCCASLRDSRIFAWVGVCDGNTCILFLESPEFFLSSVGSSVWCLDRIIFHSLSILIILETRILHLLGSVSRKALTCCETVSLYLCLGSSFSKEVQRRSAFIGSEQMIRWGSSFLDWCIWCLCAAVFWCVLTLSLQHSTRIPGTAIVSMCSLYIHEIRVPESATCNRCWNRIKPLPRSRPGRGLMQRIFDMSKVEWCSQNCTQFEYVWMVFALARLQALTSNRLQFLCHRNHSTPLSKCFPAFFLVFSWLLLPHSHWLQVGWQT